MTILGVDVSHFQGSPNWAQVKASGRDFCVLKASEGTTYVDATFAANRKAAHAAGLIVGFYHFARGGDPAAEAAWFMRTVGALQPGEFLVLDWEIAYAGDHVAWCKAWLDAVAAQTGVNALIYMNKTAMNGHNWMPVSANHGLWLAVYDNSPAAPGTCNCWPAAAMKQFSDRGAVSGVAGTCDVNAFYGSTAQLLAYGKGGATPQGDDMPTMPEFLNTPAYDGGPTISQVFKDLETRTSDVSRPGDPHASPAGLVPLRQEIADAKSQAIAARTDIAGLPAALQSAAAPVIDEAKLAAALLADPAAVQALGKAIADNLQLSPRA